jgi:hypothetical protein
MAQASLSTGSRSHLLPAVVLPQQAAEGGCTHNGIVWQILWLRQPDLHLCINQALESFDVDFSLLYPRVVSSHAIEDDLLPVLFVALPVQRGIQGPLQPVGILVM